MQGLTSPRVPARRGRSARQGERGAVAVLVALMSVVLVGFAALAVDGGSLWAARKELQNGADAGALAIAQACVRDLNSADCEYPSPVADVYAKDNKLDRNVSGTVTAITRSASGSVTVLTTSMQPSILAGVLGRNASRVSATATATWLGSPSAMDTLPLIIGDCYLRQTSGGLPPNGTSVTFNLLNSGNGGNSGNGNSKLCPNNQNNPPGGFGWLDTSDSSKCLVATQVGQVVAGQPGKPLKCGDVSTVLGGVGSILELPLFDYSTGEGSSGSFHVIGYVALQLQTYCIDQQQLYSDGTIGSCGQGQQFIQGIVVAYPETQGGSGQGPNYGITFVGLTK